MLLARDREITTRWVNSSLLTLNSLNCWKILKKIGQSAAEFFDILEKIIIFAAKSKV